MKSNTERERDILKQKIEAIENGYRLCIEIPWLWEVNSFNNEMREKIAKRIFRASEIRNFVRQAKHGLVDESLHVDRYIDQIKAWKLEFIQEQTCNCCGPCVECLGTGKTLLLIAEKYVCIACKGSGTRSQEFENLDYAEALRDDLNLHESEILEFQQLNEEYDGNEYQSYELGFDVYEALGCIHEEDEKY